MKKMLLASIAAAMLWTTTVFAYPAIQVYVDGQGITFDQPPVIVEDRTLVPMRAIFQALGSEVSWSESDQTITSTKSGDTIVLKIGDAGLYKNGQLKYTMAVPARIMNGRTLVPLRAVAEAFDAQVGWDPQGYVVTVISSQSGGENSDTTSVKADDGTVVLSFRMDIPKSKGSYASQMEKTLNEEAKALAKAYVDTYGNKAKTEYEAAKARGISFSPYYYVGSYEITREDSKFVSFYGTSTQYTGEMQGQRACTSHTFSAKNGKELTLSDIIGDSEKELQAFWMTSFGALIDEKPAGFYSNAKARLEKNLDIVGFYVTKDGLGFYLPPETIAPNEAGIISFTVKYDL
ncbi:stalk domain-containing protein [Anaerotignum propionicum]|jgi:hypothetical protein|uniref:stalk domain-containing protein n=1 Tax=Anaerotignum propionicum TaxID=28446 RepID=UPI0028A0F841|nr:stalk domain-containing protein [Anaerotignum propionicum]